jgi:hypothetical protein
MARMVPFPMLPTVSSAERRLYERFLDQLPDEYVVYHSIDWVLAPRRRDEPPVQGECDFLVAHPFDGLLVLEAKGGTLRYDPATRRWTQAGRSGSHALGEDPFHQAHGEMRSLVQILEAQPGWDAWRPSFGYGVALPDGEYEEPAHPGAPPEVVIDRRHLDDLEDRVKQVMAYWRRSGRRFGAEGMDALARALGHRVEIRLPLRLQFREEDRRIVELTDQQKYVLAYVTKRERAMVVGPAGSGKTMLAIQLAERLADGGRRTLLTCFNARLGAHLKERVGDRASGGRPNLEVHHFHELCRTMAEEAKLDVPDVPQGEDEARSYYETTLPNLLQQAARRLGPRYDAIVIDEAQDFREGWWPALLALHASPGEGPLYLFADDSQNLYRGRVPDGLVDQTVPLHENVRNPKSVHEFVSVFHEGAPARSLGPAGRPVQVLAYRDDDELAHLLVTVLRNLEEEGVALEDVAVLTPAGLARSALRRRTDLNGYRLSERVEPGTVLSSSVHAFKGLERAVIILAELEEGHGDPGDLERYLYIGGSRARNDLIVLASEPVAHRVRTLTGIEGA